MHCPRRRVRGTQRIPGLRGRPAVTGRDHRHPGAVPGLAFVVLGDQAVTSFPRAITTGLQAKIGATGIPVWILPVILLVIIFGVALHFTGFGRSLFAIGYSVDAARFSGIGVARTKFWLFVISGTSRRWSEWWTLRYGSARGDNATGLELSVIAAVLLGGVSIFGGKGTLPGVIAGVGLLAILRNALQLASVPEDTLSMLTGGLLILAVVAPNAITWTRSLSQTLQRPDHHPHHSNNDVHLKGTTMKFMSTTRSRRLAPAYIAVATGLALALSACGGTTNTSSTAAGGAASSSAAADPNAPIKEGLKVAFLPKQLNNSYFTVTDRGGKTAVDEYKGIFSEVGPSEASASSQVSYINTLTQQGSNVIATSANDPKAICSALDEARSAGAKVVTFDSAPTRPAAMSTSTRPPQKASRPPRSSSSPTP